VAAGSQAPDGDVVEVSVGAAGAASSLTGRIVLG
jgi:hypothetical protein